MHPLRNKIQTSLRLAGQIDRYHTWPTIRRQNVAEHTWHVLRLWERIFGPPPAVVTQYLLYHDCGEIRPGDMPFGAKDYVPGLRVAVQMAEHKALAEMGIVLPNIGDAIKRRCKICDLLEMFEFGMQEVGMGNEYATPIVSDTMKAIQELLPQLPPEDRKLVEAFMAKGGL